MKTSVQFISRDLWTKTYLQLSKKGNILYIRLNEHAMQLRWNVLSLQMLRKMFLITIEEIIQEAEDNYIQYIEFIIVEVAKK